MRAWEIRYAFPFFIILYQAQDGVTVIQAAQPAEARIFVRVRKAWAHAKKWLGARLRR
jgi:hypothetical protein